MKVSKVIKWLCIFIGFAVLTLVITIDLSIIMQDYYKGQINNFEKDANILLSNKQFWASVGEFPTTLYICECGSLLLTVLTALIIKLKGKNK